MTWGQRWKIKKFPETSRLKNKRKDEEAEILLLHL